MAHKNNEQNLVPPSARTPEERRINAQKAGRASGEARRRKRDTKQTAKFVLGLQPNLPNKTLQAIYSMMGSEAANEDDPNIRLISILAIAQRAMKGDLKAAKMLLEMSGDVDARTKLEQDRLKLEKERLQFERERAMGVTQETQEDTGFIDALLGVAAEVNADGDDVPEDAEG